MFHKLATFIANIYRGVSENEFDDLKPVEVNKENPLTFKLQVN